MSNQTLAMDSRSLAWLKARGETTVTSVIAHPSARARRELCGARGHRARMVDRARALEARRAISASHVFTPPTWVDDTAVFGDLDAVLRRAGCSAEVAASTKVAAMLLPPDRVWDATECARKRRYLKPLFVLTCLRAKAAMRTDML